MLAFAPYPVPQRDREKVATTRHPTLGFSRASLLARHNPVSCSPSRRTWPTLVRCPTGRPRLGHVGATNPVRPSPWRRVLRGSVEGLVQAPPPRGWAKASRGSLPTKGVKRRVMRKGEAFSYNLGLVARKRSMRCQASNSRLLTKVIADLGLHEQS